MNKLIKIFLLFLLLLLLLNSKKDFFYREYVNKNNEIRSKEDVYNFRDIVSYDNDIIDNNVYKLGIEKCLEQCDGNCVEYGVTVVGVCFKKINF